MDTRRLRKNRREQALDQFRWWGWVLLMMFVLVQSAITAASEIVLR